MSYPLEREVSVSDSAARLAARYGPRRTPAQRALGLLPVVLVVTLALGYLLVVAVRHSTPEIRWGLLGFETDGTRGVTVRWQVDRDPSRQITCELRAQDSSHVVVGRRQVVVPAGEPRRQERQAYLRTTGAPVTGEIVGCR